MEINTVEKLSDELKSNIFPPNLILSGYRGSISHGMYCPNTDPNSVDDVDLMGLYLFPIDNYIGIKKSKDTVEKFIDKYDSVFYEFKKFIYLLLNSNPNVCSFLWLNEKHYIDIHPYGQTLLDNRDLFLSKKAYKAYVGYSKSQLDRMRPDKSYQGYMGARRKELVDTFGYDPKMASHAIRLLRVGIEYLKDGVINVFRDKDAELLLQIKKGEWKLKEVKDEAERLFILAKEALTKSKLPEEPNYKKVNGLVKDILYDYVVKGTI